MDMVQFGLDDYADRSLRDMADRDYVVARACFRLGLDQHFLWLAHQALEKYLKATLLYSRIDSRRLGHDLRKSLEAVQTIPDLPIDVPADIVEYLGYLDDEGQCRYFEFPYVVIPYALGKLDRSVWTLRRYCKQLRTYDGNDADKAAYLQEQIERIRALSDSDSIRAFWIHTGFLEKVLGDKDSDLRRQLVWKNPYFGSRRRHSISRYPARLVGGNPAHYLQPSCFPELEKLVRFTPEVKAWITRRLEEEA